MINERVTEDIVREHFKRDPLFSNIKFQEQKTGINSIKNCLSTASKNKTGKAGYPEFIITAPSFPDSVIIVECKAKSSDHKGKTNNKIKDYAVDGVLHYASFLCDEFNVIAIAVSGDDTDYRVSTFTFEKGNDKPKEIDSKLLSIYSYIGIMKGEIKAKKLETEQIIKTAIDLNSQLNDYSIAEYERCSMVSAILLALQNPAYLQSYTNDAFKEIKEIKENRAVVGYEPTPERIANSILISIERVLFDNGVEDNQKVNSMLGEYGKLLNHSLSKEKRIKKKHEKREQDNYVLRDITSSLKNTILPLISMEDKGYDVLGRFYTEFIRYAGTDQKTGLVLTPQHITEFFCDIVDLNVNDVVLDICCGSGGFLISAMQKMLALAGNDEEKKRKIRSEQLVGIEKRTDMFTFACANMMMRGDGKSNIYQGDCFSITIKEQISKHMPTVSFLNPPYDVGESGQLLFINEALACLPDGGKCVAIVQMSCAVSDKKEAIGNRRKILENNKLLGVFSMPNDLFHPVGVVTCVMIFESGTPHPDRFKPYFGYYKKDGFIKHKKMGRLDAGEWENIHGKWLDSYVNRENEVGFSVTHAVSEKSEWCAEAYMETDYSTLTDNDFIGVMKNHVAFGFLNQDRLSK